MNIESRELVRLVRNNFNKEQFYSTLLGLRRRYHGGR